MFDDFAPSSSTPDARKRLGGSVAVAALLYGGLAVLVIGGTAATSHKVVEELTQVEFAKAPEPPPPPPEPPPPAAAVPEPPAKARPKMKRQELKPPDKVPDEKPKESDAPLTEAGPTGPVDGFLTGVEGGTGTAARATPPPPPPPKPGPTTPAAELKGNAAPAYSASARRKEIEGTVVVSFDVLETGKVANPKIVSGPEELRENVLKTVVSWRFQPAKRDGRPVASRLTKSIKFRLSDA
jgi:periplasmic protein TonB